MPRMSGSGLAFFIPGTAVVGTSQAAALIPSAMTISHVKVYSTTAPTGATLIVDVNLNATTIFTTQANRPTVAISGTAANSGIPEVTVLAAGDRITVDVDQIGSTVAGGGPLLVTIVLI